MALLDPVRARVDVGRLVMVPCAVLMLCVDALVLAHSTGTGTLRWVGNVMVVTFYALIIWAYLRREPAKATSTSYTAHTAAVTATLLPFALPLLNGAPPGAGQELVADGLLVVGTVWSIWSLRSLGKNLSVIAQARDVVEHGPYRWVRHPLYTGELVSSLGVVVAAGSPAAAGVWVLLVALQAYRARREEHVLVGTLPAYADYRTRTAALLPASSDSAADYHRSADKVWPFTRQRPGPAPDNLPDRRPRRGRGERKPPCTARRRSSSPPQPPSSSAPVPRSRTGAPPDRAAAPAPRPPAPAT